MNLSIRKTLAFVLALAKLHNFCVDRSDNSDLTYVAKDEWLHELNGAVPLVTTWDLQSTGNNNVIPEQLVDGGHHFDDIGGISGRWNSSDATTVSVGSTEALYHVNACTHTLQG